MTIIVLLLLIAAVDDRYNHNIDDDRYNFNIDDDDCGDDGEDE